MEIPLLSVCTFLSYPQNWYDYEFSFDAFKFDLTIIQ